MENSVLEDVLLLLMATLAVVVGLRRLRLPLILAFLIVGMIVGPHALGWVTPTETTETLAEFGIVFLLFALGLEFSLPRLIAMRGEVFTLGGLQVGGTTAVAAAVGWAIGLSLPVAILLGGAVAMSSTAIVLRQLTEQDELNRTHGRLAFGVLLFQDLAIVPFLALAGVLASPQEEYTTLQITLAVSKAAVALLIVLASGRWLLRPLFHEIAASNSPELFTFAVLFVAIGAAWATHAAGLSFALGAFLAGMMLAETEYRYQVEAGIRPFRDTLLGLFFVSIGMQLDVPALLSQLPVVIAILVAMLLIKAAIVMLAARPFAGQWFKALRSGIVLSPGGEFGFALLALSARQPPHRRHVHAAAARRHHAQHADRAAPDPAQQVGRALRAAPERPAADGARPARRGEPGARAARARDPVRLRPCRTERQPGAGNRGLRVPGD